MFCSTSFIISFSIHYEDFVALDLLLVNYIVPPSLIAKASIHYLFLFCITCSIANLVTLSLLERFLSIQRFTIWQYLHSVYSESLVLYCHFSIFWGVKFQSALSWFTFSSSTVSSDSLCLTWSKCLKGRWS